MENNFNYRYVAFIDVLGFSNLISQGQQEFESKFKSYIRIIRETIEAVDPNIKYTVFSDSIVILTPDRKRDSLTNLVLIVSVISYELLVNQYLPTKGSIAYGRISVLSKGDDNILAGTPIIEAYRYEQFQNWIGSIICPSVLKQNPELSEITELANINHLSNPDTISRILDNKTLFVSLAEYSQIPFKDQDEVVSDYDGLAIVPHKLNCTHPDHLQEDLQTYSSILKKLLLQAQNPQIQKKYRNTEAFVGIIAKKARDIWADHHWRNTAWETKETKAPNGNTTRTQKPPERK